MLPLLIPARPSGARAVFTTRSGGFGLPPYAECNLAEHVGDDPAVVAENRARVAEAVGLPLTRLVFAEQVHGANVAIVDGPLQVPPVADALVTRAPGLALAVMVADCVPVLLADPRAGVVGVAHAGRRGVALGVVPAVVRAMVSCGSSVSDLCAWIGPAIDGCCYEVPEAMQQEIAALVPETVSHGGRTRAGTPSLDLRAGVGAQLSAAGVARVLRVGGCTFDDPQFFSHRRDGVTGRFAGLVWLDPPADDDPVETGP